jgi:hypothetical protein
MILVELPGTRKGEIENTKLMSLKHIESTILSESYIET